MALQSPPQLAQSPLLIHRSFGVAASATAAPINLTVATAANYLDANWQLEAGSESAYIEASTDATSTGSDGFFDDPDPIVFDTLNPTDVRHRTTYQLPPGTYYVHVATCPAGESPDTCALTWTSAVQFTIVPNPDGVPTLDSVTQQDGYLTADFRWSTTPGVTTQAAAFIEVSTSPAISRFGYFEADPVLIEDLYQLGITHETSEPLPPGTYYVHVSTLVFLPPAQCGPFAMCTVLLWSNVLPVTVPAKPAPVAGAQAPPPPRDTAVSFSRLRVGAAQKLTALTVTAGMAEAGTIKVTGTVNVPGASKAFRFTTVSKTVAAGATVKLRPKLSTKGSRAVKKALRRRKRLKAKFTITATDLAGNSTRSKKTVRLRR